MKPRRNARCPGQPAESRDNQYLTNDRCYTLFANCAGRLLADPNKAKSGQQNQAQVNAIVPWKLSCTYDSVENPHLFQDILQFYSYKNLQKIYIRK